MVIPSDQNVNHWLKPSMMPSWRQLTTENLHHTSYYLHDDVIKWKDFPRYWPFMQEIHRSPVNLPAQRPVTRSFDVSFDMLLNIRLSKQSSGWLFKTPSHSLWRQCNEENNGHISVTGVFTSKADAIYPPPQLRVVFDKRYRCWNLKVFVGLQTEKCNFAKVGKFVMGFLTSFLTILSR